MHWIEFLINSILFKLAEVISTTLFKGRHIYWISLSNKHKLAIILKDLIERSEND